MKIDLHTHILPESWPDLDKKYGYSGFVSLQPDGAGCARMFRDGTLFRTIDSRCWDPARRLQDCDRDRVDVQVLSTVPVMFSYWARPEDAHDLSKFLNDHLAGVIREQPDRFAGLGTVPLQDTPRAIQEMDRCVSELGMAGVQIGTHVNGFNLDAPELFDFFAAAQSLGAAVFVHPWDMLARDRMQRFMLPWLVGMPAETALAITSLIFGGVLERLPDLRIAFAHGGGAFPGTIGRIEKGFHARPDLCAVTSQVNPRDYLQRIYLDSLVHDPEALGTLLRLCGPERIALGSDYPFPLGEDPPGCLLETAEGISDADRRRMLGGTALEFLGCGPDSFGGENKRRR